MTFPRMDLIPFFVGPLQCERIDPQEFYVHQRQTILIVVLSAASLSTLLSLAHDPSRHCQAATFNGSLSIPGETTDLYSGGSGLHENRLGGFGSDLYYQRSTNTYYGLSDRGPGEGQISHVPRVQQFSIQLNRSTGEISNFQLNDTLLFKTADGNQDFNALDPLNLNGNPGILGQSFDPEGLVVAPNGNLFVADEYGPALYEFQPTTVGTVREARFVRTLTIPNNLVPRDHHGNVNYVAERESNPALVSGRQDGRGFEGIAISPSGNTLFAILQDPLAAEGNQNQGRRSRNLRIVSFDTSSGLSTAQHVYQLEEVTSINLRVSFDFASRHQGRKIGASAIRALNEHELLILERDNRGLGVENPINNDSEAADVGTKRIYEVNLQAATDVTSISLAGSSTLPSGVIPVTKTLAVDIHSALMNAGLVTPEKLEGVTIGPQLDDGTYAVLVSSDNDFSALPSGNTFLDIYTDGSSGPADGDPLGRTLLPSYLYSFKLNLPNYIVPVPEPSTVSLLIGVLLALAMTRRTRGTRQ